MGFLTGIFLPKLLEATKPKHSWQAGLIGFVFGAAPTIALLRLLIDEPVFSGFYIFGAPALIFIASTTYLATQLVKNKNAIADLTHSLRTRPGIFWLFLALFILHVIGALIHYAVWGINPVEWLNTE